MPFEEVEHINKSLPSSALNIRTNTESLKAIRVSTSPAEDQIPPDQM